MKRNKTADRLEAQPRRQPRWQLRIHQHQPRAGAHPTSISLSVLAGTSPQARRPPVGPPSSIAHSSWPTAAGRLSSSLAFLQSSSSTSLPTFAHCLFWLNFHHRSFIPFTLVAFLLVCVHHSSAAAEETSRSHTFLHVLSAGGTGQSSFSISYPFCSVYSVSGLQIKRPSTSHVGWTWYRLLV